MNSGQPVSLEVAKALHNAARHMVRTRTSSLKFKEPSCSGVMKTDGKRGHMGTIVGTEFWASLRWKQGEVEVRFIINDSIADDEDAPITGAASLEEVEMQVAKAERRRSRRLN